MQLPRDAKSYYTDQVPPGLRPAGRPKRVKPVVRRRLVVEFDVPLETKSEPNLGGSRREAFARKSTAKRAVNETVGGTKLHGELFLPLAVTLTRLGRKRLDDDNLRGAMKVVRDVVAAWLGLDDAHPGLTWKYRQRPSWAAGVRVRVEHRGPKHAAGQD